MLYAISLYTQSPYNKPTIPKPNLSRRQLLYSSFAPWTHSLSIRDCRVVCANCSSSVSIKAPHVFDCVKSKCIPQDKFVSIAIGNKHTHPSHQPVLCGGVIICTKCGSTALNKIVNLSETCQGRDNNKYLYESVNIKKYNKGKASLGYPEWPYGKLLPSHIQILKSIQSQMKGVPHPWFCMPPLDPSDSEGEDNINGLSDVSLDGDTSDGSSSSL